MKLSKLKYVFLFFAFGFFAQARAAVVEVNKVDGQVFYYPTPVLQLSLLDLKEDGGLLSLFLEYNSERSKSELADLKSRYPDFEVVTLMSEIASPTVELEIVGTGLHKTLPLRQGQMGPYVNFQETISADQFKIMKSHVMQLSSLVHLNPTVQVNYTSSQVVETYATDLQICKSLKVKTLTDAILALSNMKQPDSIRDLRTWVTLKQEIMKQCFSSESVQVNSFAELLKVPLLTKELATPIQVKTYDKKSVSSKAILQPILTVQLN